MADHLAFVIATGQLLVTYFLTRRTVTQTTFTATFVIATITNPRTFGPTGELVLARKLLHGCTAATVLLGGASAGRTRTRMTATVALVQAAHQTFPAGQATGGNRLVTGDLTRCLSLAAGTGTLAAGAGTLTTLPWLVAD